MKLTGIQFDKWVVEVRTAYDEMDRIRVLNAPDRRYNTKVREAKKTGGPTELVTAKIRPIKYRVGKQTRKILRREMAVRKAMKGRGEMDWYKRIVKLLEPTRTYVANIIWWDYFACRPADQRWTRLDPWTCKFHNRNPAREDELALADCGYSPWMAMQRLSYKGERITDDE